MVRKKTLCGVALRVRNPEKLAGFYINYLGMTLTRTGKELRLSYDIQDTFLALRQSLSGDRYQHDRDDVYWKIGITLPDVDVAHAQLSARGIAISKPRQFRDIGYMCHLADPEGFQIELLQHTFEGTVKTNPGEPLRPLGGECRIGQITLRTNDISADLVRYQNDFGMTLLSKQPVENYGFDLYFLASTVERPPDADITSVSNRPWLWQRPYTTLELQHRLDGGVKTEETTAPDPGFCELIWTDQTITRT